MAGPRAARCCYNLSPPNGVAAPRTGADVKIREVIKLLEEDGWFPVTTRGSHQQFKHPLKLGRVTVAGHPNHDLAPGTLNSILKQAGLKR